MAKKSKQNIDETVIEEYQLQNPTLSYKINIKCKNQHQKDFLKILKDKKKEICFGIGSAGSGKSYVSLAYSLSALKDTNSKYNQIIIVVPTVEAGNMSLGYLKGTLQEKTEVYQIADRQTIMKILEHGDNQNIKKKSERLFKDGYIEYQVVNFVRGVTIDNAIFLINEAENYSKEEMLLLLTRIGENCKVIITGDPKQLDRKDIKRSKQQCGIIYAMEKLKDLDEVGCVIFDNEDIVRNKLIQKIIDKWEEVDN